MADLSKALPVEALDRTSWQADRNKRQARIAGKTASTYHEKGLLRQYSENNEVRDFAENILLRLNELEVAAGEANNQFTANNKEVLVKTLRGMLHLLYEQKTSLKIIEEYGYKAAEDFKNFDFDDKVDESLQDRVKEISKKFPKRKANVNNKPYQKPQQQQPMMAQQRQPMMAQQPPPMMVQQQPMMTQQQPMMFQQQPMMFQPQSMSAQQFYNPMQYGVGGGAGYRPKFFGSGTVSKC